MVGSVSFPLFNHHIQYLVEEGLFPESFGMEEFARKASPRKPGKSQIVMVEDDMFPSMEDGEYESGEELEGWGDTFRDTFHVLIFFFPGCWSGTPIE